MTAKRLVVLGATGDLTGRYLLTALAELAASRSLPGALVIVGVDRREWDTARFRQHAAERLRRHARHLDAEAHHALVQRLSYVAGDVTDTATLTEAFGGDLDASVAYLALPPAVFAPAIDAIARIGLSERSRVVVEKPFGTDLKSHSS